MTTSDADENYVYNFETGSMAKPEDLPAKAEPPRRGEHSALFPLANRDFGQKSTKPFVPDHLAETVRLEREQARLAREAAEQALIVEALARPVTVDGPSGLREWVRPGSVFSLEEAFKGMGYDGIVHQRVREVSKQLRDLGCVPRAVRQGVTVRKMWYAPAKLVDARPSSYVPVVRHGRTIPTVSQYLETIKRVQAASSALTDALADVGHASRALGHGFAKQQAVSRLELALLATQKAHFAMVESAAQDHPSAGF